MVSVLSASLVAVPALSRVEPVSTSGPTASAITTRAAEAGTSGLQVTSAVAAPRLRASFKAARTNGVTPLAAMPTTMSPGRTRLRIWRAPSAPLSSAPSEERNTVRLPPAITACTSEGGVSKVGGHSAASSTPSRPLVPAPTKMRRPRRDSARTIRSTARPRAGAARPTARTARRSARFISRAICAADSRSSLPVPGFTRSVGSRS